MYFAAVVRIDGTGRVENGDAMSQGEPGTRPDLPFDSRRKCNGNAGWNGGALARRDDHRRIGRHRGDEIEASRELALIGRQRQVAGVRQPHHADFDPAHRPAPVRGPIPKSVSLFITHFYERRRQRDTGNSIFPMRFGFDVRAKNPRYRRQEVKQIARAIRRCARRGRARPRSSIAAATIRRRSRSRDGRCCDRRP
jgi:hypothetical protein